METQEESRDWKMGMVTSASKIVALSGRGISVTEKMEALVAENAELKKTVDMLQGCILEMSELVYQ